MVKKLIAIFKDWSNTWICQNSSISTVRIQGTRDLSNFEFIWFVSWFTNTWISGIYPLKKLNTPTRRIEMIWSKRVTAWWAQELSLRKRRLSLIQKAKIFPKTTCILQISTSNCLFDFIFAFLKESPRYCNLHDDWIFHMTMTKYVNINEELSKLQVEKEKCQLPKRSDDSNNKEDGCWIPKSTYFCKIIL